MWLIARIPTDYGNQSVKSVITDAAIFLLP